MAIKQQPVLTKEDFETALVTLRLSVSEVSRESGVARHIVSHFRNYGDGLKPEQAAKLRDYFESKGLEFTNVQETPDAPQSTKNPQAGSSITLPIILSDDGLTQRTAMVCRHFFVDERLTDGQVTEAGERILESFGLAKELMAIELVGKSFSDGYDEATETKLRELWGHLARIGLVSLHLPGRILINQERILANSLTGDDKPKPKTFGDLLSDTYGSVVTALNATDPEEHIKIEEEKEEVTS